MYLAAQGIVPVDTQVPFCETILYVADTPLRAGQRNYIDVNMLKTG